MSINRPIWILRLLILPVLMLSACGQAARVPATSTPQPVTATAAALPATPSATPAPAIESYEQLLPLFNYDTSTSFDPYVSSEKETDGVIVQQIAYFAADQKFITKTGGKIVAYLVKPAKSGSYAGALLLHGIRISSTQSTQFLDEAIRLAHHGVVSLVPMLIFPTFVNYTGVGETDQHNIIKQVVELRRSLDFLLTQPGVDSQRIAYIGMDYGAMLGGVLSGVEHRIKTYVLMGGHNNFSDWALAYIVKPADVPGFRRSLAAVSPMVFVAHAAPAKLFFQSGGSDGFVYVQKAAIDQLVNRASEPKTFIWYDLSALITDKQVTQDRLDWLTLQLNLKPVQ